MREGFPYNSHRNAPVVQVEHPAAKMIAMAAGMMQQEVGDGTNFVVLFCGALLKEAEDLIRMGLKPVDVIEGKIVLQTYSFNEKEASWVSWVTSY